MGRSPIHVGGPRNPNRNLKLEIPVTDADNHKSGSDLMMMVIHITGDKERPKVEERSTESK